jgi:site-specific DNA-cytosine methylase
MDVLLINSYAGSLVLAAKESGLRIRGSYEDSGFGMNIQKLNFPDLNFVETEPWPDDDLSETIVLAHPPCAAFSNQNHGNYHAQGANADSFNCHRVVIYYALDHGAKALAIESVPGAYQHARPVYEEMAADFGYHVYHVLQNAVTFGLPQWRSRYWVMFSKRPWMGLSHHPRFMPLKEILLHQGSAVDVAGFQKKAELGVETSGYKLADLMRDHPGQNLLSIGNELFGSAEESRENFNLGGSFASRMPRSLDPETWATVIMSDNDLWVYGRRLYREEYCRVMGFPANYLWPARELKQFRMYLSKGVCPPVAAWVLDQLRLNHENDGHLGTTILKPGETADFNLTKQEALRRLREKP